MPTIHELLHENKQLRDEIDQLKAENTELRKINYSACPQCGYQGCARGRKVCDAQIDQLTVERDRYMAALEEIHFYSSCSACEENERIRDQVLASKEGGK